MSVPVKDILHQVTNNLITALNSKDYQRFLSASINYFQLGHSELVARIDPLLAQTLDQTCQIIGEWKSFHGSDQKPIELPKRLKLINGLLLNRGIHREDFIKNNLKELQYFRECGNSQTPAGWFKPVQNLESVVLTQLLGYVDTLKRSAEFTQEQLQEEFKSYLIQAHFGYFKKLLHEGEPNSQLSVLMRETYSVVESYLSVDKLDQLCEKFLKFGRQLGLNPNSVLTREHRFISNSQLSEVKAIADGLCIDFTKMKPQNGFGREFTLQEFAEMLDTPSSALFTISLNGQMIGNYIIQKKLGDAPSEFDATIRKINDHKLDFRLPVAFASIVSITEQGRQLCMEAGLNAYDLLHESMQQSLRAAGILRLFGVVRMGAQANTALKAHLNRGWQETGIIVHPYGEIDYQVIMLDL